jgi:predicted short-subunit dehydrogenase-like oxidoreductase (DUF2520 family)
MDAELTRRPVVIGDGAAARAFAFAFDKAGLEVTRWWRRLGTPIPVSQLYLLAVSDRAIAEVAGAVMQVATTRPVLVHAAGAMAPAEPFSALSVRPRGMGLLHPLRSLAGGAADQALTGTVFAVAGDDAGKQAARALAERIGGVVLDLGDEGGADALARYHAAAVLVANHSVALVDAGVELLVGLGLAPGEAARSLAALLGSTASNLQTLGLPAAITGPVARGDEGVVSRHLSALETAGRADIAELYRVSGRRLVEIAGQKRQMSQEERARLLALFTPPSPPSR